MGLKKKLLALAAGVTLAGSGIGAASVVAAGAANAATPSCGASCIDVFSQVFGTHANPGFLLDVFKRGQNIGQPVILFRLSNSDPALDFTFSDQGTVADFLAAGLVGKSLAMHYGCTVPAFPNCAPGSRDLDAFEVEYAPYGAATGLCVGLAATAVQGEKVSLQSCGVSARTVWIVDLVDGHFLNPGSTSVPLINGSDTNFSHPFVLTYPAGSSPTDNPRPQLFVSNLTGFSGSVPPNPSSLGVVSDTQLWSANTGQVF